MWAEKSDILAACSTACLVEPQGKYRSPFCLSLISGMHRGFPTQKASNVESFSRSWRHHGIWQMLPVNGYDYRISKYMHDAVILIHLDHSSWCSHGIHGLIIFRGDFTGTGWRYHITLRPRQNCRYFPDDIFKCIFLNENQFRLKFH